MGIGSRKRMGKLGNWTKSSVVRKWSEWRGFEGTRQTEKWERGLGMSSDSQGHQDLDLGSEVISQQTSLMALYWEARQTWEAVGTRGGPVGPQGAPHCVSNLQVLQALQLLHFLHLGFISCRDSEKLVPGQSRRGPENWRYPNTS